MSLLGEIADQSPRKGPPCQMGMIEAALSKADLTDLRKALADTSITHAAIFRALKARKLPLYEGAVVRHRKGLCAYRAS